MPITLIQRADIPGPNDGWNDYMNALKQQDDWWQYHSSHSLMVLGKKKGYQRTISILGRVIRRNWADHTEQDQERLLGMTPEADGWPLLGGMRNRAHKQVFKNKTNRKRIEAAIRRVIAAQYGDDAFLKVVIKAYREMRLIDGVGRGVASRLLTLARPDRCVSVNGGSECGLAAAFGLKPTTLGEESNYERLLCRMYQRRWFWAPEPKDAFEREIWSMRAALIDCFVYSPE